jgi:chromate transporter
MEIVQEDPRPGPWRLFLIWAGIGLQSFGGGASTILLIQREFVERRGWMTMEDFAHNWNLCLFAPGINLVALTILIGKRFGGIPGILSSLAGMLIPSATITCLIAAGFKQVEHNHITQAILKGVIPATGGIMLLVGVSFARPQAIQAYKEGMLNLTIVVVLLTLSSLAIILLQVPVFLVIIGMSLLGIVLFTRPLFRRRETRSGDD